MRAKASKQEGRSGRAAGFTVSPGLPIPLSRWAASEEAGGGETPRGAHVSGAESALVAAHSCCFVARHTGGNCAATGSPQGTRLNGLGCSSQELLSLARAGGRAKLLAVPPDRLSELVCRRPAAQFLVEAVSFLPPRLSRSALDRRRAPLGPLSPSPPLPFLARRTACFCFSRLKFYTSLS